MQQRRADGYLGGLGANRARRQDPPREHLQAVHQRLGQRAQVISTALLPVPPAAFADNIDLAVAPSRAGRSLRPGHRTITWRDRWCCPARRNRRVALPGVIRAIAADGINRRTSRDLIEQLGHHLTIACVLVRHQHGTNLAGVRVHRQMHLAPGTTLRITVLAYLPFALAKHLQADTVDYQMQRFAATQGRQHDVEIPGAAAQHRVVGHRQIREGELVHTPCETLQRAQWQAKYLFESEQHLDDRVSVDAWSAALERMGLSARLPQVLPHPDRHVTSGDQPGVVDRPVFNPILALGLLPLLFVLAHRLRPTARIYASSSKVNSPAALVVARKRQPWLPQDICNNANVSG